MPLWNTTDAQASKPLWILKKSDFDGSDTNLVSVANDTITINAYGYDSAEKVIYRNTSGNSDIGGLTADTAYYMFPQGDYSYQICTDAGDLAGSVVTISAVSDGAGLGHSFESAAENIVFIDEDEARVEANKAKGISGAGWWQVSTYTDGNSNTRYKTELLVAASTSATDAGDTASDDATFGADLSITIGTQPQNASVTAPDPATFTVVATTNSDTPITYQWQVNDGGGYVDIVGATSASYTVTDSTGLNGYLYQVILSIGSTTVTSTAATLTVA